MNGFNVLIIEDEGMISMMVEDMLTSLGHRVTGMAANLEDGLKFGRQRNTSILRFSM